MSPIKQQPNELRQVNTQLNLSHYHLFSLGEAGHEKNFKTDHLSKQKKEKRKFLQENQTTTKVGKFFFRIAILIHLITTALRKGFNQNYKCFKKKTLNKGKSGKQGYTKLVGRLTMGCQ